MAGRPNPSPIAWILSWRSMDDSFSCPSTGIASCESRRRGFPSLGPPSSLPPPLMSQRRAARLNEQFKREISQVLRREVHDPRIGTPTVTAVDVTPDLWLARVFVRPGPAVDEDEGGDRLLEGLRAAAPFIRRTLGSSLELRRVPELRFELDLTLDRALRIERILQEVLPADAPEEGSGESAPKADQGDADPAAEPAHGESTGEDHPGSREVQGP
ncbi:MAG: 30S ribosome-binding factor RbfA [Gemmatimonadales bacterium]|nr:MAG: 30S ribosome-binding factor RbfA [Gemmatimonadales bacterium]